MKTRPGWRLKRVNAVVLSLLVSVLCALLMVGCGTSRESTNSYTQTVTAVDESGAARTLRLIATAQMQYSIAHGGEYGMFEDLTGGSLLDSRFRGHTPEVGGYVYTMKLAPASGGQAAMYAVFADPKTPASGVQTSGRHLYMDSTSNVIHASPTQTATANDPAF
jgi:hypothetical protein